MVGSLEEASCRKTGRERKGSDMIAATTKVTSLELFKQLVKVRVAEKKPDPQFFRVTAGFTQNAEVVAILALSRD